MMTRSTNDDSMKRALDAVREHGGILRTKDAISAGIHPRTLYALRDDGSIERLSRGLYRLTNAVPLGNPDLVAVALRATPQSWIMQLRDCAAILANPPSRKSSKRWSNLAC